MIECPICFEKFGNILAHIRIHPGYEHVSTRKEFKKIFPEWKGPLQVDNRKKLDLECPVCKKSFSLRNCLVVHIQKIHPEYYETYKQENLSTHNFLDKIKCKICCHMAGDLKQHITRKHFGISWEEYCLTYNHPLELSKIVNEEYKKCLSENKTDFYKYTERGKELLKEQSFKWSLAGGENPANNPISLQKIIRSIATSEGRKNNGQYGQRGVKIFCTEMKKWFRSFNEYSFYVWCLSQNIKIEYEPGNCGFYWKDETIFRHYLPDFYLPEYNMIIEAKSTEKECKEISEKYKTLTDVIENIGFCFKIGTPNMLCSALNISNLDLDYIYDMLYKKFTEGQLKLICPNNSKIVRRITQSKDINNLEGVRIYGR